MLRIILSFILVFAALDSTALAANPAQAAKAGTLSRIDIPGGTHGLHFDDIAYAAPLQRIVVPAAQTGALVLIRPGSDSIKVLPHVAHTEGPDQHGRGGATSADFGAGMIFAGDHGAQSVVAIDPANGKVVAQAALASGSDYVRYVAPRHEIWVTEPRSAQIQRFALVQGKPPMLRAIGAIAVPGGPESLVIDAAHGVAYTNEWKNHTLQLSLEKPRILARWGNSCDGSRGLALAARRHLLFVGCKEGKVAALDTDHDGKVVSTAAVGAGVDIIAWNPRLQHLYAPGAVSATLSVLALVHGRDLKTVATVPAAAHSHCVATDGVRHAYVCDPSAGAIIVYRDRR